jgi:class 3 adenylate cyclase/predicted ATPase
MDVAAWLRGLGLEEYTPAFRDNDVDGEVLPELTAEDLISIGVTSVGHRRKLLAAIAALEERPSVAQPATSAAPAPPPSPTIEAERRQLTVMFCDLVGSTPLAARLDPEDLHDILGAYHRCATDTVARVGGFVAKYMGDGVLVYFGYPLAHEDDAERAVRAGLALIDAVGQLDLPERLQIRIGIASGLVVVGDLIGEGAAQERSVVGETPNLAARLQGMAAPGQLIIAEGTQHLVGTLFELADLGLHALAGFAEPQRAWQVLAESSTVNRFEALRSGTTPLVGRDEERELLSTRWQQAKTGDGQVVLVSGEPGIGKSRLTASVYQMVQDEAQTRIRWFCSPHHQDSALYPIIVQIERAAEINRDDGPARRLAKLHDLLPGESEGPFQLIAEMLSLPNTAAALSLSGPRRREMLFEALLRQFALLAQRQPILAVFEDVHWIDPTSRELLELMVERARELPALLVVTFRPEFKAPWADRPHLTSISLNRLNAAEAGALVLSIADLLSDAVVAEIVERTDGVPLFVEELTKAILESSVADDSTVAIPSASPVVALVVPPTLHASLIARLDRIGVAAKEVAQIGSVLGREFGYDIIERVAQRSEPDLRGALEQLSDAGLLFCRGTPPHCSYQFKHALVRDAAYSTLLRRRRRILHESVARVFEEEFPETAEAQPELLAHHYGEAGEPAQAFTYWVMAGRRSAARSAMAEAVAQLARGLEQLALLPDGIERQRQELDLRSVLGPALLASKGIAAPETGRAYSRARELWEQLSSPSEYLQVPYGQSLHHAYGGELDIALRLDEDLLRRSREQNDSAGLLLGHSSFGRNLMLAGRFADARPHLEEVLAIYDPALHEPVVRQAGVHPRIESRTVLANVLFCLGFADRAFEQSDAALAEARAYAHPPSLASTLSFGLRLLSFAEEKTGMRTLADQFSAIGAEQGFAMWRAQGAIYGGWAMVLNGGTSEGISLLRSGVAAWSDAGSLTGQPHHLSLLARACAIAGDEQEAVVLLDDALQIMERTGERRYAAELYRLRGKLVLHRESSTVAQEFYVKALSIARRQQAKAFELRAAIDLARLWAEEGRGAEARGLLAPVYGWFTEGVDTTDQKSAKALLDELA